MKTRTKAKNIGTHSEAGFLIGFIIIVLFAVALTSCSDDNESAPGPDTREQFIGEYEVEDISATNGNLYQYNVTIAMGSKGELLISNFADVFNTPIKAVAKGNALIIESQSFTNPSKKTLTVEGSGTLAGGVLTFNYLLTGSYDYTGNCTANKSK